MAYTADRTWVSGEIPDGAMFNTYIRDNLKWLSTDKPMFRGYSSANISTGANTWTDMTMDTERFDNASIHSTVSQTARMTVPASSAGKFLAGGHLEWAANSGGTTREGRIRVNDSTVVGQQFGGPRSASIAARAMVPAFYAMAVADWFSLQAFQDSTTLNVLASGNYSPEAWCLWHGI